MASAGDVVRLKSGGAHMTVLGHVVKGVLCGWMDCDSVFRKEVIPNEALSLVQLSTEPQPPRVSPPRKP